MERERGKTISDLNFERLMEFDKPLESKYIKDYMEILALLVLQYFDSEYFSGLERSESPDLIDISHSIGVEVTQAVSGNKAKINGAFTKYRLNDDEKIKEYESEHIELLGGFLSDGSIYYPVTDNNDEKKAIQDAIQKKIKKAELYKKREIDSLYLFTIFDEPLIPISKEQLCGYFSSVVGSNTSYKKIFLYSSNVLFIYNVFGSYLDISKIDRDVDDELRYKARKIVEDNK